MEASPTRGAPPLPAPAPKTVEIPADWVKFDSSDAKFSMAVPKEWMVIKPKGVTPDEDMEKLKKVNPMLGGAWEASSSASAVVAQGANRTEAHNPGKLVHNFNVRTSPSPAPEETDEVRTARQEALKTAIPGATAEVSEVNGVKMVRYVADVKLGTLESKILGYQVGIKGTDYTFTFTSNKENYDKQVATFEKIMGTVVFK